MYYCHVPHTQVLLLRLQLTSNVARMINGSARRRSSMRNGEDVLSSMWNAVRSNNGIMVSLSCGLNSVRKCPLLDFHIV